MSRNKVENKAQNTSISLPYNQIQFLKSHNNFSISEFVRIHLQEYINLTNDVEQTEKELHIKRTDKL